jgi:hypothetical protein
LCHNDDDKPVIGCGREWYQDIIILPAQQYIVEP